MGLLDAVEGIGEAILGAGKGLAQVFDHVGPLANPMPVIGALSELDDAIEAGARLADWVKGVGSDRVRPTANSPILQGGQLVIAGMRRTTGSGEPDHGDQFGQGSQRFHEASQVSATAEPTDDWTGSGAGAYAGQNGRQRSRAVTMADLDREVQTVIAREAIQIEFHRGKLDDQSNWLADVGVTTLKLGNVVGIGPAVTAALETQAVIAAVGSSSMELGALSNEVGVNAAAVRGLVAQYDEVARSVGSSGPMSSPPPPPPGGPGDNPADRSPDGESTTGHSCDDGPIDVLPGGTSAPSSGGGGGPAGSGPSIATPSPAPTTVPNMTVPTLPQSPISGGGPAAAGGVPGAFGGLPSALGGAPAGAGDGRATSALGPLIQAAVQRAFDRQSAEEKAREDEKKRAERKDEEDPGKDDEDPVTEGVPDGEEGAGAVTAPGTAEHGRAPIHVEFDVDPERLHTPMTVTLDRHRPIVVSPTLTA